MDPTTVRWLIFAVLTLVLLFFALRNAAQAWLLHQRLVPAARAREHLDQPVALTGEFHLIDPVKLHGRPCVYYHTRTQQWMRSYGTSRRGSWRTMATRTDWATYGVKDGDAVVLVVDEPSEVHGMKSETESSNWVGLSAFFADPDDTRELRKWLPLPQRVTVVGRLRDEGTVVLGRDPKLGLLVSPRSAQQVALQEALKAALFLAAIPLAHWFLFRYLPA